MRTFAALIIIFLISYHLRELVVEHLVVVDPASNHLGWYMWSLLITLLRWQWWGALLLNLRAIPFKWSTWYYPLLLLVLEAYLSYDSRYSWLAYGTELTPSAHQAMVVLNIFLSVCDNAILLLIAITTARRPLLLPFVIAICALKVFTFDLQLPQNPYLVEISRSVIPIFTYLIVAALIAYYIDGTLNFRRGDTKN